MNQMSPVRPGVGSVGMIFTLARESVDAHDAEDKIARQTSAVETRPTRSVIFARGTGNYNVGAGTNAIYAQGASGCRAHRSKSSRKVPADAGRGAACGMDAATAVQ
jgi:hypothetical protein